jgi:hypothetical protein
MLTEVVTRGDDQTQAETQQSNIFSSFNFGFNNNHRRFASTPGGQDRHSSLPPPLLAPLLATMSRPATARQATMPTPPGSPPVRVPLLTTPSTGAVPLASPTSPRSGFLGSFMRGRSRAQSVTNAVAGAVRQRVGSPGVEQINNDGGDVTRSVSSPNADAAAAAAIQIPPVDPTLRRTHKIRLVPVLETNRSFTFAPVLREMGVMHVPPGVLPSIAANAVTEPGPTVNGRQPPLLIKIGRFTDKAAGAAVVGAADMITSGITRAANGEQVTPATAAASAVGGGGGDTLSPRAAFKSKVVSRSHAEIWCEPGGKVGCML